MVDHRKMVKSMKPKCCLTAQAVLVATRLATSFGSTSFWDLFCAVPVVIGRQSPSCKIGQVKIAVPRLIVVLWAVFALRGVFLVIAIPIWEGFDEPAHFGLIHEVSQSKRWPLKTDPLPKEVLRSLRYLPLPNPLATPPLRNHRDYWRDHRPGECPSSEREEFGDVSWAIAPEHRQYEAQQAPAYYLAMAPLYGMVTSLDLVTRVHVLRCVNVAIGSLCIPLAFLLANRIGGRLTGALAAILVAALPQFALTSARICNDGAAAAAVGVAVITVLRTGPRLLTSVQLQIAVGLVTGLCILTKGSSVAIIPALCVYMIHLGLMAKLRLRSVGLAIAITMGAAFLSGGWWYLHNIIQTGSLSGEQLEIAAQRVGVNKWDALFTVDWPRAIDFTLNSHLWLGNWSFLVLRSWMYTALQVLFFVAAASCARKVWWMSRQGEASPALSLTIAVESLTIVALVYHCLVNQIVQLIAGTFGHYLNAAITCEATLLAIGLMAIPVRQFSAIFVSSLVLVELFASHIYLFPYYSGMAFEQGTEKIHAFPVARYFDGAVQRIAASLAMPKMMCDELWLFKLAWVGYLVSLIATLLFAIWHSKCPFHEE